MFIAVIFRTCSEIVFTCNCSGKFLLAVDRLALLFCFFFINVVKTDVQQSLIRGPLELNVVKMHIRDRAALWGN